MDAADIKPRPPISIRLMMTVCPKPLHCVHVSKSTSPVTQVAEVAVKSAGRKPQLIPLREETGKVSSNAPSKMIPAKTNAIVFVGFVALDCFRAPFFFTFPIKNIYRHLHCVFSGSKHSSMIYVHIIASLFSFASMFSWKPFRRECENAFYFYGKLWYDV